MKIFLKEIKHDLPASLVVFFVALPLCLGIALASGAPMFSGIIAGVIGGVVVGICSGSALGVSGPATGLTVLVITSFLKLDSSWETFFLAVFLAGVFQLIAGFLRAGGISNYIPSPVIKGMLSGIGLLIIIKQIPNALGYEANAEKLFNIDANTGIGAIDNFVNALSFVNSAAIIISVLSIFFLLVWENKFFKKNRIFQIIQGPLVVVVLGIFLNILFESGFLNVSLSEKQLVKMPIPHSMNDFINQFTFPDFSKIFQYEVYSVAFVIALVASLETLLSVEATDKLDPFKRITPANRELKAQGIGNMVSGLLGGLPLTQVIVRSSTNISFGGRTKVSTIVHGFLLLISAIAIPALLNKIPLATLACILLVVGYKLAKPVIFIRMYKLGMDIFIPFISTIIGMVVFDLLTGIAIGFIIAVLYFLKSGLRNPFGNLFVLSKKTDENNSEYELVLPENISFFNKAKLIDTLNSIPGNSKLIIDGSKSTIIHHDVVQVIKYYQLNAVAKKIDVKTINLDFKRFSW